jgi:serine protease
MASPHVAGVAALVLAANPLLNPDQVEAVLTSTAVELGAPGRDDIFGHGLVNAFAAVNAAAGSGSPDPVLGLSTLALAFSPTQDTLTVQVTNVGGGVLDVTGVVASTDTGGDWLTATPVAGTSTSTNVTSILAEVDRTGLADGVYAGSIDVQSNGGNASISVSLVVSATPTVEDVTIFVIAVDAVTFETHAQDEVNPTTILDYSLLDLPAGDYILAAGSDDDADGFICGAGDRYCGFYPTLDQPLIVTVAAGEALSGLDFTVSSQFMGASAGAPARGFALR